MQTASIPAAEQQPNPSPKRDFSHTLNIAASVEIDVERRVIRPGEYSDCIRLSCWLFGEGGFNTMFPRLTADQARELGQALIDAAAL